VKWRFYGQNRNNLVDFSCHHDEANHENIITGGPVVVVLPGLSHLREGQAILLTAKLSPPP
jgi:hypothetical protein